MATTKQSNQEETNSFAGNIDRVQYKVTARYHAELARFSTWLFSGVIISITFLLLAGLRNPHTLLLVFMYIALGAFSLTSLLYPIVNLLSSKLIAAAIKAQNAPGSDKKKLDASAKGRARLATQLKTVQYIQQIIFVIGVLAALGFAIEVSLYMFATPTASPTGQAG